MISDLFLEIIETDPAQLLVELNSIISVFDIAYDRDAEFSKSEENIEIYANSCGEQQIKISQS